MKKCFVLKLSLQPVNSTVKYRTWMVYPFMLTTTVYVNFLSSWIKPYLPGVCQCFLRHPITNSIFASSHSSADWTRQENWWTFVINASFPSPIKSIGWLGWKTLCSYSDVTGKNPQVITAKYSSLRPVSTMSRYSMFLYVEQILKHKLFVK